MRLFQVHHLVLVFVVVAAGASDCPAQLVTANATIEQGEVRGGQELSHRFELINQGTEPIEIVDIERGCGCVAPRLETRTIPPGGRAALAIDLRTLGQAEGPHAWNLTVKYQTGGQTKSLPLTLRGTVHNEITVKPAVLGLHVTKLIEQEIVLVDSRPAPLRVVRADLQTPGVTVKSIERDGAKTRILLSADAAKLPAGRQEGLLTLTTDDAQYGQLRIPLVVTKAAGRTAAPTPEQAVLRLAPGAVSASTIVRLRSSSDQPVKIAKIEPSDPSLTCTWAAGPGNDATLKIQVQDRPGTQSWLGQVEVHLASSGGESVTIPVLVKK